METDRVLKPPFDESGVLQEGWDFGSLFDESILGPLESRNPLYNSSSQNGSGVPDGSLLTSVISSVSDVHEAESAGYSGPQSVSPDVNRELLPDEEWTQDVLPEDFDLATIAGMHKDWQSGSIDIKYVYPKDAKKDNVAIVISLYPEGVLVRQLKYTVVSVRDEQGFRYEPKTQIYPAALLIDTKTVFLARPHMMTAPAMIGNTERERIGKTLSDGLARARGIAKEQGYASELQSAMYTVSKLTRSN